MNIASRKPDFDECMRTTKAQIRLHICAVWSAPLLFALWKVKHINSLHSKFQHSSCILIELMETPKPQGPVYLQINSISSQLIRKEKQEQQQKRAFRLRVDSGRHVSLFQCDNLSLWSCQHRSDMIPVFSRYTVNYTFMDSCTKILLQWFCHHC